MAWLGRYSYTAYVAHAMLDMVWHRLPYLGAAAPLPLQQAGFVAGSLVLGVILSHLVERPALRLRERWIPRRHRVPAARSESSLATPTSEEHDGPHRDDGGAPA